MKERTAERPKNSRGVIVGYDLRRTTISTVVLTCASAVTVMLF